MTKLGIEERLERLKASRRYCPECQRDDVEWELRHKGEDVWCLGHDECSVRLYLPTGTLDVAA